MLIDSLCMVSSGLIAVHVLAAPTTLVVPATMVIVIVPSVSFPLTRTNMSLWCVWSQELLLEASRPSTYEYLGTCRHRLIAMVAGEVSAAGE